MHLRVKPIDTAEMGWAAKLQSQGIKVSLNSEGFGCTQYLLKQGADILSFTQEPHRIAKTDMHLATAGQIRLAKALIETGVARLFPKP